MPIGDLLASISGGQPAASSPSQPKRKAEDELKSAPKVPRKDYPSSKPSLASRPLDRPNAVPRSTNGARPGDKTLKPLNSTHRVTKPVAPARPSPTTPTGASSAAKTIPPKKGSYAEVLARAKKAQESMGQVGRIQHKKSEKKEKEAAQKPVNPGTPGKKYAGAARASGYQGTGKANARPPANGMRMKNGASAKDDRGKAQSKPMSERERKAAKAAEEEQERKMKRAAQATTGYTGTARPKPGAASKKRDPPRGGALLNSAPPRHSGPRRSSYEDDYDEELDDFIDYDDEEDDQAGGPRYHYDSEGSSDMEAGIDDLEGEERRAETIARREDIEEERLEKSLKAAKEERKRKALDALRAKRR